MTTSAAGDQAQDEDARERQQESWNSKARGETEAQRLDRNLMELLQELRVAQTGIQILFAFLLTLPFSARFDQTTAFQRNLYVLTLLSAAGATALLIAPVSVHRFVFRLRKKEQLVRTANWLAHGGLAFLAVAVVTAVLLVLLEVMGTGAARWYAAGAAVWFLAFWYALPLWIRSSRHEDDLPDDDVSSLLTSGKRSRGGDASTDSSKDSSPG